MLKKLWLAIIIVLFLVLFSASVIAQGVPNAAYCNLDYMDISDDLTLGKSDGALMLRVTQTRTELDNNTVYNYSINHASCYVNIVKHLNEEPGYDIISTEPYENIIPHGLRYTTTLGVLNFLLDMNEEFWEPNTQYMWQAYCYCLPYNLTNGAQDQHDCWYDIATLGGWAAGLGNWSGTPVYPALGCVNSGNFTTGNDLRTTNGVASAGTSWSIVFFIMLITGLLFIFPYFMDYLKKPFVYNPFLNLVLRRACFILAAYLMILNSGIMYSLAIQSGLVINELILYMRLFGIFGYLLIIYILLKTVLELTDYWKSTRWNSRMGKNNEDDYSEDDGDYYE